MPARILFAAKIAGTDGFGDAWWDGRCGEAGDCPQQSAMGSLVVEGGLEEGWKREWRCGNGDLERESGRWELPYSVSGRLVAF